MTNRQAAVQIVKKLRGEGFQALLAGGCVRDMLLGRRPNDYDVATDAKPNDVIKLFRRTLKVGAKFGVVVVLIDKIQVEVATFRTESDYEDGRHPSKVRFTTAAEDAARRDFTINAMFYDPIAKKVIDYYKGQADLKNKIIRTVGDPVERFSEDYLRMLRAVRFSTQLGFSIEPRTQKAVCNQAENITKISGERIAAQKACRFSLKRVLQDLSFPVAPAQAPDLSSACLILCRGELIFLWDWPRCSPALRRRSHSKSARCSSLVETKTNILPSSSTTGAHCSKIFLWPI
jgi:hypothetical protein